MRILLLAPQPFYEERGTPIAVRLVAEGLAAQGHVVDLLSFHEGQNIAMPGVRHLRIAAPPGVRHIPIGLSFGKLVCDLWMFFTAIRLMMRRRYDVIHAVEEAVFLALPLAMIGKAKLVYDADSILSEQIAEKSASLAPLARIVAWLEHIACRRSDLIIAVCPAIMEAARRSAPSDRVHLLPDIAMEADGTPFEEDVRALAGGRPVALYIGNLEHYQGVGLLLSAMAVLPARDRPVLLVIGGNREAIERHQHEIDALGLANDVLMLGPRPLGALSQYLSQGDILCSPRLKGRNTPMKIFSYMASGKPILATRIESHTQVLDADCAMLVTPDAHSLAAGLSRLSKDVALRTQLGQAARLKAQSHYSHAAFIERLRRAYATITPTQPPPASSVGAMV